MKDNVLALVAALVGGVAGYVVFQWIAAQGFYALVLPGAGVGLAAGYFKSRSLAVCIVCGVGALVAGILSEWRFAPFIKDASLGYFLAHLHQLRPLTLILIALGVAIGFGVPFRHRNDPKPG
jgi:uncharacterized membrane protein